MHQKCAACSFRIARVVDMHLARRSLPVSREYRHQAKPDAEIGMWLCLVLIFARDMERPKCQVHVHGHARHFHARSVIDHDLIVTSLYVQVPTDTIFCDYLVWELRLQQKFYWFMRGGIEAIWRCVVSRIHRCSVIAALRTFFLAISPEPAPDSWGA